MHPEVETFRRFAEEKLRHHMEELKIIFSNRSLASEELKETHIIEHQKIFNRQLNEKLNQLVAADNPSLKEELRSLKDRFLFKLDAAEPI